MEGDLKKDELSSVNLYQVQVNSSKNGTFTITCARLAKLRYINVKVTILKNALRVRIEH